MMLKLLPPRVQDHQHPDPCSQVLGVGRDLQESLLGGVEEQPIQELTVAQGQCTELMGQGEDDVEVGHGQEVGLTFGQPGCPLAPTALGTASVAAGMIVVSDLATVIALRDVPAQLGRAAQCQVLKRLPDMGTLGPTSQELGSVPPNELTQASVAGRWALRRGQPVERADHLLHSRQGHVRVQGCGPDPMMAQQCLDRAGVDSRFQEMGGMAVAQGVRSDPRQARGATGPLAGFLHRRGIQGLDGDLCPGTSMALASFYASRHAVLPGAGGTVAPARSF